MSNARFSILQARAISDKRVSDAQFRTLAALGMYADRDGWCFPSLARIGADCNKSKQAAGRDIIHLKKIGYVEVYPQFDKTTGSRRPNKYRLKFDPPVNVDDSTPSTSDVDTPSTPDVDVNDLSNDSINKVDSSKPDLLDAIIHFEQKPQSIRQAVKEYFKLNVNWDTKLNRQWMEWALGEKITAEQIKLAADRWRTDKQFNWQVPTLKLIFEKWDLLMDSGNPKANPETKIQREEGKAFYA